MFSFLVTEFYFVTGVAGRPSRLLTRGRRTPPSLLTCATSLSLGNKVVLCCPVLYCKCKQKTVPIVFCRTPALTRHSAWSGHGYSVMDACEHGDYTPPAARRVYFTVLSVWPRLYLSLFLVCVTTAVSFPVPCLCDHGCIFPRSLSVWPRLYLSPLLVCVTTAVSFPAPFLCDHGCIFPCSLSVWPRLYLSLFLVCVTTAVSFPVPCLCDHGCIFPFSLSVWLL